MTDVFINEAIGRNIRRNERPDAKPKETYGLSEKERMFLDYMALNELMRKADSCCVSEAEKPGISDEEKDIYMEFSGAMRVFLDDIMLGLEIEILEDENYRKYYEGWKTGFFLADSGVDDLQIIVPSGKDTDDDALTEDLSDAIRKAVAETHALRLIN